MTTYLLTATRNYLGSYAGLSRLCWEGIILSFLESMLVGVYYFLPIYFINELHFTIATAGFIVSFYGIGAILGGYLGGRLSDKFSSGVVSVASLFLQAMVFLVLMKVKSVEFFSIDLFLMGIASYGFITSNHLWVLDQCENDENKKLKALNILSAASNFGFGLSTFIITALAAANGFQIIFILSGIFLLFITIYFSFAEWKRPKLFHSKNNLVGDKEIRDSTCLIEENNKIIWLVLACTFLIGLIIFQISTTYSFYIQENFPESGLNGVSLLFALNSLLVMFFQTPISGFFSRYNKILMAGLGAFLLGFGMFILAFSTVFSLAVISCVIYTAGEMLFFSVVQLICYQSGSEEKRGHRLGMYRMVYASSRVIGPSVGGIIYQQWGGKMIWYVCGLIGLFCLSACNYLKKELNTT